MKKLLIFIALFAVAIFAACGSDTASNAVDGTNTDASPKAFTKVETPQHIKDMMAQRGEQDAAEPVLKVLSPADGSTVESSTVRVLLELTGDLKGYKTGMDHETGMGNHIHVILDNQPYEAYYNLGREFELRNVPDGEHTLRVFASRPWHESYKNEGSFQMVRFTVKNGGADEKKPATTNTGQQMSNARDEESGEEPKASPTPEGKEMPGSKAGDVDPKLPLLTYSRPKGEYKGRDADPIMIDFWLTNAKLTGDGGEYRVRYTINDSEPRYMESWAPLWLEGWSAGKHTIKLELVDKDGNVVENGGYNSTTREITVVK